ncbi:GNAT family N-acetyltransferase [Halioxenophilus sp. WMMB6]|uniref:GNAT family N-acetyltransferase n=1 Tax=Halioxenophilus sp. WMMB6 TaxID=3073815 RepID=UPI00295EFB93|nr:GNAT family N-acetyltransferase [Halioxenophilus sp. WMMB6]
MIDGYTISSSPEAMDLSLIHSYISRSYWAKGIGQETLAVAIANSLSFGVFLHSGEQVGFARMITDRATFAYMADVFILEEHRGKGLSKWLLQVIMAHPQLQGLRRLLLATRDAHGLYVQFGFKALAKPETFMEVLHSDIYSKNLL